MRVQDRVVVVTGAASGIGRALARRFHAEGAAGVVVADRAEAPLREAAAEIGALAVTCDVAQESQVTSLVEQARDRFGRIDVFCSNAGIALLGDEHAANDDWQRCWDVHLMAHVFAARAVVPEMVARGEGYLLNTASAAGLLTHVNSATYAVTKHAAVAFAEWLSINYGMQGVRVSVLCPQGVRTAMTAGREASVAGVDGMIEPEALAECVVETMEREAFLILPHAEVLEYMRRKTGDYDRWLGGMRRLKERTSGVL